MAILLGRVLVLITCTEGLKLATVTTSALLIWYGSAALMPGSGCCTDPELGMGLPDGYWGWVGGSGWAGVSPGMGMRVAARSLRTGDSAVSWTSLALHTQPKSVGACLNRTVYSLAIRSLDKVCMNHLRLNQWE